MATQKNSVLIGKMRQLAEECLRRHAINPEYSNEIMHTADTYRDLLKLCDIAKAAGNEALEKAACLLDEMGENAISGGAIVLYESVAEAIRKLKEEG